ncbi:MAG: hypothetical protein ACRYGK_07950 [Janthinobacterium lividum]
MQPSSKHSQQTSRNRGPQPLSVRNTTPVPNLQGKAVISPPQPRSAPQLGTPNLHVGLPKMPQRGAGFDYPLCGFRNSVHFKEFATLLYSKLEEAGHGDVEAVMMGSTVSGINERKQRPFGPHSDHDIALASLRLHDQACANGLELRTQGDRTEALTEEMEKDLNLTKVRAVMHEFSGRPIHFMVYQTTECTTHRKNFPIPRPQKPKIIDQRHDWSIPRNHAPAVQVESLAVEKNPGAWRAL